MKTINPRRFPGSQRAHDSLVASICDLLTLYGVACSRVNQRPVLTMRGWRCQGADIGFPDIVAVLPPSGRTLLVEAKTGGATLSPAQKREQERWTKAGAVWVTARSAVDVVPELARAGITRPMRVTGLGVA